MSTTNPRRAKGAVAIPETRAMDVPFDQLRLSDKNVRTIYDKNEIKELAESIAEHGLIQSLSIRPVHDDNDQTTVVGYEVPAGGRRFRALELLVKQKRMEPTKSIPCVLKTAGFAEDDSYVENKQRAALHPIDEFRAFQKMIDAGKTENDIAKAHRVTVGFVRQRLRLASASPLILQAYRDEEIELEQLMAYCVTDDHSRQESVFQRLTESYDQSAHTIRRTLMEETVHANDRRVRFLGLNVYEKAGGPVERDLFSATNEGYLTDTELLNGLVADKLQTIAKSYRSKGWKWVEAAVSIPHDRKWGLDRVLGEDVELTNKEQKRLDKLNAEMGQLDALDELTDEQDARRDELQSEISVLEDKPPVFSKENMARAGVFLSISHMGTLDVDAGFIKEDDATSEESDADGAQIPDGNSPSSNGHAPHEEEEDGFRPLSAALTEDLTSYRTVALRNAVAQDFNVAFISVVHAFALSHLYTFSHGKTCLQLKMDTTFPAKAPGLDAWPATKQIADRDLAWRKMLPKSSTDLWGALLAMEHTTLQSLFAHLASLSVNAAITPHVRSAASVAHANDLFRALKTDMVKEGWTTTADNYLNRVSKDRILEAVSEARGEETKTLIAHLKKEPMAKEAERLIVGKGWLPEPLRIADTVKTADDEDDRDDTDEDGAGLPVFLTTDEAPSQDAAA
jgi:ParB family chromosome partitioning protein